MSRDDDDLSKKFFGKTADEILFPPEESHSKYHSANAFCGNAGQEELKHLQSLLDELTDKELHELVDKVGIKFMMSTSEVDRDTLETVVDEADREVFYKSYHDVLASRK
jgi:hypothetical protein